MLSKKNLLLTIILAAGLALIGFYSLYPEKKEPEPIISDNYTYAPFEPVQGCYLGAYVTLDFRLQGDPGAMTKMTGKPHASYFHYVGWSRPFPIEWVAELKKHGAVPHIAWEPNNGLDEVQDNEYVRTFLREAGKAGVPVFLRFASEMNGPWVAWHGDPKKYIEKWRLITEIAREEAPNVAMVWAPFQTPQSTIMPYYPGDDYVDWAGMNIYSVWCHNGTSAEFAGDKDPLEYLDFIYEKIPTKPFFIAEFAVAHYDRATGQDVTPFAVEKLNHFYQGIKEEYPRVKAVYYFTTNVVARGKHNDYRLIGKVLTEYQNIISDPYYLPVVENNGYVDGQCVPYIEYNNRQMVPLTALGEYTYNPQEGVALARNKTFSQEKGSLYQVGNRVWVTWPVETQPKGAF